ncbi:ABC transporter ATP-binding protein [Chloroflexota bacterium]
MSLMELINVGQAYNKAALLEGINLKIERGEVIAMIGPTGAGKTTLIRIMALLEPPATGEVWFDGIDIARSGNHKLEARRRMAYVQQKPIVFSMNVFDNIACGLKWRHIAKDVVRQRVENALELIGMEEFGNRDARTLSGGETQRVAIARALVTDPELLLLDEPTANLDPLSATKIEGVLEKIIAGGETTVVMTTHDMAQGQRLAGKIGVLIDGKMPHIGSPTEVFFSPNSTEVAEFVGVENMLPGVVTSRDDELITIDVNGNQVEAVSNHTTGDKVYVLIRPEDLTFSFKKEASSARNRIEGDISRMTPLGPLVRIELDCQGISLFGILTKRSVTDMNLSIGSHLDASFKVTAIHIITRRN